MQHDEFIGQVQARAQLDSRGAAERAVRATLETLGERIPEGLAENLAAQLPQEIAENLRRTIVFGKDGTGESFDRQEFVSRIANRSGAADPQAVVHARVVLEVVGEAVSGGMMSKVRDALPEDIQDLSTAGSSAQRSATDPVVVGLVADPGLPTDTVARLTDHLPEQLNSSVDPGTTWRVEQHADVLPLDEDGEISLLPRAQELKDEYGWDLLVYLTDLPRLEDGQPVLADISTEHGAAVVSLPALGMFLLRRVRDSIAVVVAKMHTGTDETRQTPGRTPKGLLEPPRERDSSGPAIDTYPAVMGLRGRLRLVFGLLRSNRPWRLLPSLSSTAAAAFATGAFGVFFTSIWGLAASMSWWRLTTVTVISILVMTAWLIGYSGLIERPGGKDTARRAPLYNAATTVSVMTSVVLVYASLFAVLALAALIIIPFHFMETELMRAPTVRDYLVVPWLSASMGVTAGAFGSSFDDENEVRSATFSQREYDRYQAVTDDDENGDSASEGEEDTSTGAASSSHT